MRATILFLVVIGVLAQEVVKETLEQAPEGAPMVTKSNQYKSEVTLYIEAEDGTLTPSGWSTRKEEGGNGRPFEFTPGVGLIAGWTEGVLMMREGERAKLHVPSSKGYGDRPMGSPGSGWHIPASSNLCFDIKVLPLAGRQEL